MARADFEAAPPVPASAPRKTLTVSAGGATASAEWPACDEDGGKDKDAAGAGKGGDKIGATVLKVAGAAATGITATGFIVVVGAALFWVRFAEVKLPATQAVGLLAKNELLVQGAQVTIVFLAIALVAVLFLFFVDPEGKLAGLSRVALIALAGGGVFYVFTTQLGCGAVVGLSALAAILTVGCFFIGFRSGAKFWPLALAVFVATLVFSAATGILVVKQQKYVQAVAVLRGANDSGLTGIYVSSSDKTIYIGRPIAGDPKTKRTIFDVPREGATFTVGPLESLDQAALHSQEMLWELLADRERNQAPAPKPPAADGGGAKDDKQGTAAAEPPSPAAEPVEVVAKAFGPDVTAYTGELERDLCLVRYGDAAAKGLLGHWWTSCEEAKKLGSVREIRDQLALPGRFQSSYDARIEVRVPAEREVTYLTGTTAAQCEHDSPGRPCGYRYPGGGLQYYLPRPNVVLFLKKECTDAAPEARDPQWAAC
ncbi:MAG TPA: hypothetical protein VFX85_00650 [Solirubrobacterales bacterium]|nr:hypothetical protein [Solirubrobacterales bacterium]